MQKHVQPEDPRSQDPKGRIDDETLRSGTSRRAVMLGTAAAAAFAIGFRRPAAAAADDAEIITQTATFSVDPTRTEEALDAIRTLVGAVEENEPGVLAYIAHQPSEGADSIVFFEVYANAEALENHSKQPHLAALGAGFQSGLFKPPVDIVKLDRVAGFAR